jgi:hypothetical protein
MSNLGNKRVIKFVPAPMCIIIIDICSSLNFYKKYFGFHCTEQLEDSAQFTAWRSENYDF